MQQDCKVKRAQFIDSSVKIRETFSFAHPIEQITAMEKYCTAMYGSNLWDLRSTEAVMLCNSWKLGMKLAWNLPRGCRSYLLQTVLPPTTVSMKVKLLTRFRSFFRGLLVSPSREVQVIARLAARDMRSTLGSNLALIREMTGLDPWVAAPSHLRQALVTAETTEVPAGEEWRVQYLHKLLELRLQSHYSGQQEEEATLTSLLDSLVVN